LKKLFLVIPILLLLVGCGNLPTVEVNDRITFDINREMDAVFVDGEIAWSVVQVTDEFLSEYDSYVEFIDNEIGIRIAILPHTTLYDFRWIGIGWRFFDDRNENYERVVLYSAGELQAGIPFVIMHREMGSLPHRGISFVDANGERRYFTVGLSMAGPPESPGAFIIREFDNL